MNQTKVRNLKVGYQFRETGTAYQKKGKRLPKIILQGHWLEKAGFTVGEIAKVIVADTFIHIIKQSTPKEAGRE